MEEEEEPDLTPELITELSKKSLEEAYKIGEQIAYILSVIADIRRVIEDTESPAKIVRLDPKRTPDIKGIYAIDSSFRTPLPLVYGDLFVVVGGYIRYPRARGVDLRINRGMRIAVKCGEEITGRIQTAISKIVERKIAREILKDPSFETKPWEILMFDGPIIPLWPIVVVTTRFYTQEEKLLEISGQVAEFCEEKKKTVIGIVKRVRSHFIGRGLIKILEKEGEIMLDDNTRRALERTSDKALATLILQPGEALLIGHLGSSPIIDRTLVTENRRETFLSFLNENPWTKNVFVGFIKPYRSRHVVRFEIADYAGIGLENILSWLNANSSHTACPYPIDLVDRLTNMTNSMYELIRKIIIRGATRKLSEFTKADRLGEIDLLLELADLQKKYVPNMG